MAGTILQGLILAGIIGVGRMLWRQNEATATQNVALAQLPASREMMCREP